MKAFSKVMVVALVAGGAASAASAQQSLSTIFLGGNGGSAGGTVFFDVSVGATPLTVTGFDTNTSAALGASFGFQVYTVLGTYLGNETNVGAWTPQASGSGVSAGAQVPSPVTLGGTFVLAANTTYGMAIVLGPTGGPVAAHSYTNGTGANQVYSNADLTLTLGAASNAPFTAPLFTPRVWNGTIKYTLGGVTGACCRTDGVCILTSSAGCTSIGGIYRGDNTPCATANCPQPPTGACCLPSTCSVLTAAQCTTQGGTYQGNNTSCGTVNCPITEYVESGDAGDLPSTAAIASGNGALRAIRGNLAINDADMFQINICSPGSFEATTVGGTTVDTQLFLFDPNGVGISHDDDDPVTGVLQSRLSSLFTSALPAGNYYLAISAYNMDPQDVNAALLWVNTPFNVERAPDGPGAANPVRSWAPSGGGGAYTIALQGSCFVSTGPACYPNCDGSSVPPILNVSDFICFQTKYAAGDPYANCDGSTTPPILNVSDFICFQTKYAAGCS